MLFLSTVKGILSGKTNIKLAFDQMYKIGVESLPVALITSSAIGMVFAVQIAGEFVQFGAGDFIGGVMAIAISRELAPVLCGIVISSRVAACIAAEIGTMKVTQQVDALESLGTSPITYLVIPRFIGATVMLPVLTIFADIVGFIGAYIVAVYIAGISGNSFIASAGKLMSTWDLWGGLIKTLIFGMVIAIIACYKGLNAQGGAKGVGEATTSAVVTSLISVIILNYFLSVTFYQ